MVLVKPLHMLPFYFFSSCSCSLPTCFPPASQLFPLSYFSTRFSLSTPSILSHLLFPPLFHLVFSPILLKHFSPSISSPLLLYYLFHSAFFPLYILFIYCYFDYYLVLLLCSSISCTREYWMIYREPGFLAVVHCPKNGPHFTSYRAEATNAILYGA